MNDLRENFRVSLFLKSTSFNITNYPPQQVVYTLMVACHFLKLNNSVAHY